MAEILKLENFKNIYLTDKVADKDKFDHQDFAEILWRIIQEKTFKEDTTPFNIGIFGKWGVGKSTVVNLFRQKLDTWNEDQTKEKKYTFIEFKIWKFSEDALKRKFIFTIGKALLGEKKLDELNVKVHGQRIFEHSVLTAPDYLAKELFNWRKHTSKRWLIIGLVAAIVIDLLFILVNLRYRWIDSLVDWLALAGTFIVAQLPTFWTYFMKAIYSAKLQIAFERYDSDEQFEEEFVKVVSQEKELIKIIFIDDLDRCPEDKVIEALETIKTYLDVKTCIFIIACDDEVVKRVVAEKRKELLKDQNGAEYLNKFFQYRLRIPPFIHRNMRDYAKGILADQNNSLLALKDIDDILEVLIHRHVVNPRKAISLVNSFAADFEVILKREESDSSKLRKGDISSNLPALAFFTVIKNDYPNIYDLLIKDSELLKYLIAQEEGKTDFAEEYHKSVLNEATRQEKFLEFMQFLNGASEYVRDIDDCLPFIYLDADRNTASVKGERQQELHRLFRTGQAEKLKDLILELKSDEEKRRHFEFMADWLDNFKVSRDKRNGLRVMFEIVECFPGGQSFGGIANRISSCFVSSYKGDEKWIEEFNLEGVMFVLKSLLSSKRQELIEKLIETLNKSTSKELALKLLRAIFKYEDIVTAQQARNVQLVLNRKAAQTASPNLVWFPLSEVCDLIEQHSSSESALRRLLGFERIEELCARIYELDKSSKEKNESENKEYEKLVKIFDLLDRIVLAKRDGIKKRVSLWVTLLGTSQYYYAVLKKIRDSLSEISGEMIPALVEALSSQVSAVSDDDLEELLNLIDDISAKSEAKPVSEMKLMTKSLILKMSDEYTLKNYEAAARFIVKCDDGRLEDGLLEEMMNMLLAKLGLAERFEYTTRTFDFLIQNSDLLRKVRRAFVSAYIKELYDVRNYDNAKFPQGQGASFLGQSFGPIFALAEAKDDFTETPKFAEFLLPQTVVDLNQKEMVINLLRSRLSEFQKDMGNAILTKVVPYLTADKEKQIWGIKQLSILAGQLELQGACSDAVCQDLVRGLSSAIKNCDGNLDRCKALELLLKLKATAKRLGGSFLSILLEEIQLQFGEGKNHSLGFHGFIENFEEFSLETQIDLIGKYLGLDIYSDEDTLVLFKKTTATFRALTNQTDRLGFIDKFAIGISLDKKAWTFYSAFFDQLIPVLDDDSIKYLITDSMKKIKSCQELPGISRNRFSIINKFKNKEMFDDAEIYSLFSALFNDDNDAVKDLACDLLFVYFGDIKKIPKVTREGYKVMIEQAFARTAREDVKQKMTILIGKEGIFKFEI